MKVFVVTACHPYETHIVVGIFSDLALATEQAVEYETASPYEDCEVVEVELDTVSPILI